MKKILSILLLAIITLSANAKLTKIDFKWSKIISFNAIALNKDAINEGKVGKIENGKIYIQYTDYGSAGSICKVSIDAGMKNTSFDGSKVVTLEDVIVLYDPDEGTLVITNKLKENLLWVFGTDLKLLLFYDIVPFIV